MIEYETYKTFFFILNLLKSIKILLLIYKLIYILDIHQETFHITLIQYKQYLYT